MNKRVKGIIGLGAVLVVLGGSLAYLKLTEPKDDADSSSSTSSEAYGAGTVLVRQDPDTITKIEISNSECEYSVLRTTEATEDASAVFTVSGYEKITFDNSILYTLANNISELDALSIVADNKDEAEKYGLADPEVTATFYTEDGDEYTVYVGDISPVTTSTYFMMDGDDAIYTVSSSKMANYRSDLNTFISKIILEEPAEDAYPIVNDVRIEREDLDYDIYLEYDSRTSDENYKGGTAATHIMTEPVFCYLSVDKSVSATNGLFGLTADDFYSVLPSESDIAEAGLNNPFCTVSINCDNGASYKFLMSEPFTNDEGVISHYAMLEGGDIIYIVSAENAIWGTMSPIDITSRIVFGSTIWDLREMNISGKDFETISFKGDGTSKDDYTVTKNNAEFNTERFRLFYSFLLSTAAEELAIDKTVPATEPLVEISYKDAYMDAPQVVSFYEDTALNCLIVIDGQCRFTCTRSYVDTLIDNVGRIDTGEDYVTTWK